MDFCKMNGRECPDRDLALRKCGTKNLLNWTSWENHDQSVLQHCSHHNIFRMNPKLTLSPSKSKNNSPGALFEKLILANNSQSFKPTRPWVHAPVGTPFPAQFYGVPLPGSDPEGKEALIPVEGSRGCCSGSKWWWVPPVNSVPVEFCRETNLPNSHLTERIFWAIAFILGFIASVILINDVWDRYNKNPVIVTFEPRELGIDSLPFPAVTLCNINKFRKSTVDELLTTATEGMDTDEGIAAAKQLRFVKNVCNAQLSFAKEFHYAATRGEINLEMNNTIPEDDQDDMLLYLLNNTPGCKDMIRLCMFGEQTVPCDELFKPFITDYGKCCTFNILPYPLLMKDPRSNDLTKALLASKWSQEELNNWDKWHYHEGFTMPKDILRPYRQHRAGLPYGLSILIDANVGEYFCPASDAVGFRFAIHNPLEMPHVAEFANVLELGKEIYVEVNPDVINSEDAVKNFKQEDRKCLYSEEGNLTFFRPYTGTNCLDECTAKIITLNCSCSYFYMPRPDNVKVCNTARDSDDAKCIDKAKIGLLDQLERSCGHCNGLCQNLEYHFQTTVATLQKSEVTWGDPSPKAAPQDWAHNEMSIVHIFFGSDSTVPKLRKRLYGPTDLIASTGGLLGLCLGVSILSGVETVYYFTVRACCKICKRQPGSPDPLITRMVKKLKKNRNKEITLDPHNIPMYSNDNPFAVPTFRFSDESSWPQSRPHPHQS